jgi:predicted HTH domain antitoxin
MLTIDDKTLEEAKISASDLRAEIAAYLFSINKLSFGSARVLSGLDVWSFQELLSSQKIPLHYDIDDLKEDLKVLNEP